MTRIVNSLTEALEHKCPRCGIHVIRYKVTNRDLPREKLFIQFICENQHSWESPRVERAQQKTA